MATPIPPFAAQRVAFDTLGHRGSAFDGAFNGWHVLAITQLIRRNRTARCFVVTPSRSPPGGGPAGRAITGWIEAEVNRLLEARRQGVMRIAHAKAQHATMTNRRDCLNANVSGLGHWSASAERHGSDLTVISELVDPTFDVLPLDWDGEIRMDPSSPDAMRRGVGLKARFNVAFACDTHHHRHDIVTPSAGLLAPAPCRSVAIGRAHTLCREFSGR